MNDAAIEYFLGVDGGGTGTRVVLTGRDGTVLASAEGGPSALSAGIDAAWQTVLATVRDAFARAGVAWPGPECCAIGLGLSGVHNLQWKQAFIETAPPFGHLHLATDGYTSLIGAHAGAPGVVIALGTGSIAEALLPDGSHREAGGWGFPAGDEASGAWLGLRAAQLGQMVLDGRKPAGPLALAVIEAVGGSWAAMMDWNSKAGQRAYATLAPLVIRHGADDPEAQDLLAQCGVDVERMARALDPDGVLPVALCGGLAEALRPWLPAGLLPRLVPAKGNSVDGALYLARR